MKITTPLFNTLCIYLLYDTLFISFLLINEISLYKVIK